MSGIGSSDRPTRADAPGRGSADAVGVEPGSADGGSVEPGSADAGSVDPGSTDGGTVDPGTDELASDDEALSWGAEHDTSYVEGPEGVRRTKTSARSTDPEGAQEEGPDEADDDGLPEGVMSSGMLVAHGVFGGLYLLYTVAWLIFVGRAAAPALTGASLALWHVSQWMAVVAAPLWFATTLFLTPLTPARRRMVWLLVGALVLIPWPLITGAS